MTQLSISQMIADDEYNVPNYTAVRQRGLHCIQLPQKLAMLNNEANLSLFHFIRKRQ
jgi:hypothetical protein